MIIQVDETLSLNVSFDLSDREEGYEDDIRFAISDTAPKGARLFEADRISFLLTPAQAEKLAMALLEAAKESRETPGLIPVPSDLLKLSYQKMAKAMDLLEEALKLGGDAIEIERKDRRELVTAFVGNVGVGIGWLDSADLKEVWKEINQLKRKKHVSIGGRSIRLRFSEYKSFGERVYRVEIRQIDEAVERPGSSRPSRDDKRSAPKEVPTKTKPSPLESRISRLAKIADELREGKSFPITRLTTIKKLCEDVTAAKEFALHFAKRAQEKLNRKKTPDHIDKTDWLRFKDVVGRAIVLMEGILTKGSAGSEPEMLELLYEIRDLQNTYENQNWGPVRMIASSETLVVEHALRCFPSSSEVPYWSYHLAREYSERYNAKFGTGLIPDSAPMVEEIAEFWKNYYLNSRER
jgi:hypothetical protein